MALSAFTYQNTVCVVSGACGGIGAALSRALAIKGAKLVLTDLRQDQLDALAASLNLPDDKILTIAADLTKQDSAEEIRHGTLDRFGEVGLLINNAGAALYGDFKSIPYEDFQWMMELNFTAQLRMIYAFLPHLLAKPGNHLVNISSLFGVVAPPTQSAYCASKFALRGLSEALAHELEEDGLGVSTVLPGGIATNIAKAARIPANANRIEAQKQIVEFQKALKKSPDDAADIILRGVRQRKKRIVVGSDAHTIITINRLFPANYWNLLKVILGNPRSSK